MLIIAGSNKRLWSLFNFETLKVVHFLTGVA